MNTKKKVTAQEIASMTNVSVSTVSRALSRPHMVSDKTRQQIMQAVEKTGYTINEAARNLRSKQTNTIVILVPNIGNPLFSNIVEGIETICAEQQLSVLIADTQKASMSPQNARAYFSQNRVDGVIILDGLVPLGIINSGDNDLPIVFAGEWNPDANLPVIRINDQLGVYLAVKHLHQLGHQHLGQLTGLCSHIPGNIRQESFNKALHALSYDPRQAWTFKGDFSMQSGAEAAENWIALPESQRPSGLFCASDAMAFGFISRLNRLGVKVPEQASVVGYDDLHVAEYYVPALTTIHQPRRALGQLAAKTLLALMNQETIPRTQILDPWLVKRDSTTHYAPII